LGKLDTNVPLSLQPLTFLVYEN